MFGSPESHRHARIRFANLFCAVIMRLLGAGGFFAPPLGKIWRVEAAPRNQCSLSLTSPFHIDFSSSNVVNILNLIVRIDYCKGLGLIV
jgi:hypothetical protein